MIHEIRDRLRSIATDGATEFLSGTAFDAWIYLGDLVRLDAYAPAEKCGRAATVCVVDEKYTLGADKHLPVAVVEFQIIGDARRADEILVVVRGVDDHPELGRTDPIDEGVVADAALLVAEGGVEDLAILERRGVIRSWHDRAIVPGHDWSREIDSHLRQADLVLLLISKDFIASDYIEGVTVKEWLGGQPLAPREAAKLCAKIADIKVTFSKNAEEVATGFPGAAYTKVWHVDFFWSYLYYDFVPELLDENVMPTTREAYEAFRNELFFPDQAAGGNKALSAIRTPVTCRTSSSLRASCTMHLKPYSSSAVNFMPSTFCGVAHPAPGGRGDHGALPLD